ncbi:hypothetical protein CEXT_77501 [Caerostris extrusa]|uniref:Uncharacterized protein n=1 Tax=Caerostris extrusa TaxID=172846 RepID=A0AAV4Y6K8_CAEEX|nr:hypothetical protein CEXT_77501 [Caerostris extrusa]
METAVTGIDIVKIVRTLWRESDELLVMYTMVLPTADFGSIRMLYENGSRSRSVRDVAQRSLTRIHSMLFTQVIEERCPILVPLAPLIMPSKRLLPQTFPPLPRYTVLLLPFQPDVWVAIPVPVTPVLLQHILSGKQSFTDFFINLLNCKKIPTKRWLP